MKNVFRLLIIAALAVSFALPAFAQDAAASPQADDPAKTALYEKFVKERGVKDPASQKAAFDTGKEFLSKYGTTEDQYVTYVRGWVAKYEKALRDFEFEKAVEAKDFAKAQQYGQQILAAEPENVHVHLRLTEAGFNNAVATKTKNNAGQTVNSARRALELIEQGKAPEKWMTFTSRDEAIGGLNYTLGYFTYETSPDEAVKYLIKSVQSNSKFSKEPTAYIYLGEAYYNGEFKKLADEYKAKYEGQPETPEGIALYERVNQSLDRFIDAYARAAALTTDAAKRKPILDRLTPFYKSRHDNSDAGLQEYVAGVLNRPLPLPGQPVTPASTGATTPAAAPATGGSTATTTTNTNGAKPSTPTPKP
jgi:hypothetical protein